MSLHRLSQQPAASVDIECVKKREACLLDFQPNSYISGGLGSGEAVRHGAEAWLFWPPVPSPALG